MNRFSFASLVVLLGGACGPVGGGEPTTGPADQGDTEAATASTGSTTASATTVVTATDTGTGSAGDTGEPACDPAGSGECEDHEDCATQYCESYGSAPPDPAATCIPALPEGEIRLTGTIRDWVSRQTLPGIELRISGALPASMDAVNAPAIVMATSDADGRFVTETDQADGQAIGLVALAESAGYYLTATGIVEANLATGSYPPGAENHDIWLMPQNVLANWTAMLMSDPVVAPFLPLGENGGVIGRVRDPICGLGVAGVEVQSRIGEQSNSIIRYLDEDELGFNAVATGSSGLFVIVGPALAEKFDAYEDGVIVSDREGTVGSTPNAAFSVTITTIE